jgi:hypothetical protein
MTLEVILIWAHALIGGFLAGWLACGRLEKRDVNVSITAHIDTDHNQMEIIDAQWKMRKVDRI